MRLAYSLHRGRQGAVPRGAVREERVSHSLQIERRLRPVVDEPYGVHKSGLSGHIDSETSLTYSSSLLLILGALSPVSSSSFVLSLLPPHTPA
jgi:hypothetical protein